MKTRLIRLFQLVLVLQLLPVAYADELADFHRTLAAAPGEAKAPEKGPENPDYRKYPPDRLVDTSHLKLDVTPDFKERSVSGVATLKFKPIGQPLSELKLNGIRLRVSQVESSEALLGHQETEEHVILTFREPIPVGRETTVSIHYQAFPQIGLYFRTPELGYPATDSHIWTQGEDSEGRNWFPCQDYPNAKFTSEIICHVPEAMQVFSNGRKLSETKEANGMKAVHWSQEKPHTAYLISLIAGYFAGIEDKYKEIPLGFYAPISTAKYVTNSFRYTKDMFAYFEEETGIPYPWAKYNQICVRDFTAGGMENTSTTTLTENTLFSAESEDVRSSDGLVAHELAHQWFGDLITCKDWAHLWLNEGFATFYERLYTGYKFGQDEMLKEFYESAQPFFGPDSDTQPIVYRKFNVPFEQFNGAVYSKGAWVMHMLRSQLGASLYRDFIRTYLQRFGYHNVVTEDLMHVAEEVSGRSLAKFFEQWVYRTGHPILSVTYGWDERKKLARVSLRQTQKVSEEIPLFEFPLTIRFKTEAGVQDKAVNIRDKEHDFYFPLDSAPELVRIDPKYEVFAQVNFPIPPAMLREQINDETDIIGRLLAITQLGTRKDAEARDLLKQRLQKDPHYFVRYQTAAALRAMQTSEALEVLLASTNQPSARVRLGVVRAIGGYSLPAAQAFTLKAVANERNPDVAAVAVAGLAAIPIAESQPVLLGLLKSDTFNQLVLAAALRDMRAQDHPAYVEPILATLKSRSTDLPTPVLSAGLETLGRLGRLLDNPDATRDYLISLSTHPRQTIQVAAINGLGSLEDTKAIPALENLAAGNAEFAQTKAAQAALAKIRAARKPTMEVGDLRKEVTTLQTSDRELRKQLAELKKQVEALGTSSPTNKAKAVKKK